MVEQNLQMMQEAVRGGADLVLTTEAVNYAGPPQQVPGDYKELISYSLDDTADSFSRIAAAGNCLVIAGLYRIDAQGKLRNSAFVWDAYGKLQGIYDKVHLAGAEKEYLCAGDSYRVFDTPFGRIGVCICWDMQFPECARSLSLMGADLIVCPTWGWEAVYGHARSYENGVYTAAAMAVPYGADIEGIRSPSEVSGPDGTVLLSADRHRGGVFFCEADITECRPYRKFRLEERRPVTYRILSDAINEYLI